jgi:hypothetical protein
MRKTKVAEAYERAKMIRDVLHRIGRCMEVTEDKAGILWERWLVGQTSVILFSTPSWTEVFRPVTDDMTWAGTTRALEALAAEPARY